jgi:hypothetical protein
MIDDDERVEDESYTSVVVLSKAQMSAHVCSKDDNRKGMTNVRVTISDDGKIVTDSTDGKLLLKVKEDPQDLHRFPLSVNPSEKKENIIKEVAYIPGDVLDEVVESMPKRRNFCSLTWQKSAVFSFSDEIEIGTSDKQGKDTILSAPLSQHSSFPPVEQVWPNSADAKHRIAFQVPILRKMLDALEAAEVEVVAFEITNHKTAMKFEAIKKPSKREVLGLIMPYSNDGNFSR